VARQRIIQKIGQSCLSLWDGSVGCFLLFAEYHRHWYAIEPGELMGCPGLFCLCGFLASY
jgi:hypothetical protein